MHNVWALRIVNLKLGILWFSSWSKVFNPNGKKQSHAQVWVRFLNLPHKYWRSTTLFEIASSIGSPLIIDENTLNIRFDHYAHLSVDLDISEMMFKFVLVEREGFMFNIEVFFYMRNTPNFAPTARLLGMEFTSVIKLGQKLWGSLRMINWSRFRCRVWLFQRIN